MSVTRREFIGTAMAAAAQTGAPAQTAEWYDRPMRWAQIAFTEDDPGNYDPNFWFDFLKRIHADAACLSAGGIVAFYPTKVPLHYRSRFLGNLDSFGEMVAGCRKLGMNVIGRTDPHACREDVFQQHPDWVARDAQGKPRHHWANPELYVTCALGPYNFEFMTAVTREIVETYKVDGIFSNRWSGHGQCWCEHCRKNFKDFSGFELPTTEDPADPARRQYTVWVQKRLFECWRTWDQAVRSANPNASFIANSGGGALSQLDMKTVGELSRTLFADRQARNGVMPPWANGKNGKEYRATLGRKPIGGIFSVGVEEPYRWKDSVQSPAEIRVWVADGIANGLRPWFTKFNAKPFDKRWMPVVEDIYNWHWRNERYLRNEEPLARVAMVYSQQTAAYYGGPQAVAKVEDHALGFYQAMVESRIPFEMVHDNKLDQIDRFKVLVLPNVAALSQDQCAQLEAYVRRGGSIVATHETSLYDEWGTRRTDFGLANLFGCSYAGKVDERQQNAYLTVERNPSGGALHPLLAGLEGTPRVIAAVKRVHVTPRAKQAYAPLTLVPSYPDLPMEDVYPRVPKTDIPMAYCGEFGKGRVVYLPMDLDRTFWEVLSADHLAVLRNAIQWAMNEPQPVRVEGKGLLDVTLWRQKSSVTAHLVNLTNPMSMKGPYREFFPVGPFEVTVQLPAGAKAAAVKLLTAARAASFTVQQGAVKLQIPRVEVHEIAAIDLA